MKNRQQLVCCFACNAEFKKRLSEIKASKRHFCSRACFENTWAHEPRAKRAPRKAICHPERAHKAKGLCSECYGAAYVKANPEVRRNAFRGYARRHPDRLRAGYLKRQYGLTPEALTVKLKAQNGLCAVCHTREATDVDHNHTRKQVRDLLCGPCNRALGLLRDCAAIVYSAAEYLEKWEARAA